MSGDDPFFGGDADRTILRPRPTGRRPAPRQAAPQPASPSPFEADRGTAWQGAPDWPAGSAYTAARDGAAFAGVGAGEPYGARASAGAEAPAAAIGRLPGGLNPITSAATTLIALIAQLRESASHPDPQRLFSHVCQELKEFEARARGSGEPPDHVLAARYLLCTALDETVLNTPWGSQSAWAEQTLLSTFHNETWGGEKFFQLLDRLVQDPARNLHLLELMYLLLALGFEGKYRIRERGHAELERIEAGLYQTIRMQRGDFERSLSPRWRGVANPRSRLARYVPLWVVGAIAAGVLVVAYAGFLTATSRAAEPAMREISLLGRRAGIAPVAAPVETVAPRADLRPYLARELADGLLEIRDTADGQIVRLGGDGLFSSGRAEVQAERVPLLLAIADALNAVPGNVVVTGHTDNVPMSAFARYKSNWDLSQARAEAVAQILRTRVASSRLVVEGVADTQPLAPNDTAEGRSRNRRVEILLVPPVGRQ